MAAEVNIKKNTSIKVHKRKKLWLILFNYFNAFFEKRGSYIISKNVTFFIFKP